MLDQALRPFNLKVHFDLDLMASGQTLAQLTARAVERLDEVMAAEKPDVVLVQGDTTTAFCGALAAFYRQDTGGPRGGRAANQYKFAPFPEEINRRLITVVADYHFAPRESAKAALLAEGVAPLHKGDGQYRDRCPALGQRKSKSKPSPASN